MAARGISENMFAISLDSSVSSQGQESCAICLGVPKNKSFANNCLHEFCFVCLQKWSKVRAECPLCMQPFSSIIHTVKSDHEYYEHVIHRPDQSVSRVPEIIPSNQYQPQQQMIQWQQFLMPQLPENNAQTGVAFNQLFLPTSIGGQVIPSHAGNRQTNVVAAQQQTTIQNQPAVSACEGSDNFHQALHSTPTTSMVKQSVVHNQLIAPSVALQTCQQATPAQVYVKAHEVQLPLKAETLHHYSLRSKTRRGNITEGSSNGHEFCPLNSSTPQRLCRLQLSQVTADPVQQSQWWHRLVCDVMRNQMVQEMVQAIIPDPIFMNQDEMETVCGYARKIESDLYKTANSKQQYTLLHSSKTKEFNTDMNQKQKRIFIQRILSSEFLALERPLDLSNPRTSDVGLINRNATVADKEHLQIVAEEDAEEDERNNAILYTESDGSDGRNGSSMGEDTHGRIFSFQNAGQGSLVEDDSEEVVILERDPKPLPELIILSDSDEE